jgi:hypothetical protein
MKFLISRQSFQNFKQFHEKAYCKINTLKQSLYYILFQCFFIIENHSRKVLIGVMKIYEDVFESGVLLPSLCL